MSDGLIGNDHITIPDFTEPVVGFRKFRLHVVEAREAYDEEVPIDSRRDAPFIPPNEFITVDGRMVRNEKAVEEARKKWEASRGKKRIVHHPAIEETTVKLCSPTKPFVWDSGVNEAKCEVRNTFKINSRGFKEEHGDDVPSHHCECGLYSYYDVNPYTIYYGAKHMVYGIVTSWGKMEVHATGMRSEFMKIEALMVHKDLVRFANQWNPSIPIITTKEDAQESQSLLRALMKEFGSPLPESMRPLRKEGDLYQQMFIDVQKQKLAMERDLRNRMNRQFYGGLTKDVRARIPIYKKTPKSPFPDWIKNLYGTFGDDKK